MLGWSPSTLAVRMSPSGSESLRVTGSTTLWPARTPKESSFAVGGRFSSSRSAAVLVIVVVRVSRSRFLESSVWISCSMTQSSTSSMLFMICQDRPNRWSLRITRSWLTRSLSSSESSASGIDSLTGSWPSQARTKRSEPPQAP